MARLQPTLNVLQATNLSSKDSMTNSETAVNDLRLALGEVDYERAIRAFIDLQQTGTIDFNRAGQLCSALGVVRKLLDSLTSDDDAELDTADANNRGGPNGDVNVYTDRCSNIIAPSDQRSVPRGFPVCSDRHSQVLSGFVSAMIRPLRGPTSGSR
jgi:hypothetical protein